MTENTYAIIDNASGFIWGAAEAESPLEACRKIDADIIGECREYETVAQFRSINDHGYHVYKVPFGFDIYNGRDEDEIALVQSHPRVACVRYRNP